MIHSSKKRSTVVKTATLCISISSRMSLGSPRIKCLTLRCREDYRPGCEMTYFPGQPSCPSSQPGIGPVALRMQIPLHLPIEVNILAMLCKVNRTLEGDAIRLGRLGRPRAAVAV